MISLKKSSGQTRITHVAAFAATQRMLGHTPPVDGRVLAWTFDAGTSANQVRCDGGVYHTAGIRHVPVIKRRKHPMLHAAWADAARSWGMVNA